MTVGNYNVNQIWPQLAKFQHQLHIVVVALLVLYLVAFAADLTWRLIPQPELSASSEFDRPVAGGIASTSGQQVNLAQVKRLNLFGDLTAPPVVKQEQQVTDAPETKLNLSLTGVVASSEPSVAAAIIENKGVQNTYGINDKIDGTNASLQEVFNDRVIIKNGARRETLMLDGIDYKKESNRPQTRVARSNNVRPNSPERTVLPQDVVDTTRELRNSPSSFTDYIAISPYRRDGQLIGYRISPGKKPKLFKAAGFKAGDIVAQINGLDLTDPQQSLEAMNSLRSAQSLQLTINRGEETLTLYLDIPSAGLNI